METPEARPCPRIPVLIGSAPLAASLAASAIIIRHSGQTFTGAPDQGAMVLRGLGWIAYCASSVTCIPIAVLAARGTHWSTRLANGLWGAVAWAAGCAIAFVYLSSAP